MSTFDHLRKLKVTTAKTLEYPLPEIADDAVLIVRPSGEANPAYFNDSLRQTSKTDVRKAQQGKIDLEFLKRGRDTDRKLYPKHVVVGWRGVIDSKRALVPFNQTTCTELFEALPDDVFDQLRAFCNDVSNFREFGDSDLTSEERTGN